MDKELIEAIGDNHISTSVETPLLLHAFEKADDEKIIPCNCYKMVNIFSRFIIS